MYILYIDHALYIEVVKYQSLHQNIYILIYWTCGIIICYAEVSIYQSIYCCMYDILSVPCSYLMYRSIQLLVYHYIEIRILIYRS